MNECPRLARESLIKAIQKTEHRVGCEILKDDKMNIELVNHHIAEVRNGIARLVTTKKIEITDEGGLIWAVIDLSLKVPEIETVDPKKALDDQRVLQRHLNSMRQEGALTVTELQYYTTENAKQLHGYAVNVAAHVKAVKEMTKVARKLNKLLDGGRFLFRSSGVRLPQQSLLQDFI